MHSLVKLRRAETIGGHCIAHKNALLFCAAHRTRRFSYIIFSRRFRGDFTLPPAQPAQTIQAQSNAKGCNKQRNFA